MTETMTVKLAAVCPRTGVHLRPATTAEVAAYQAANAGRRRGYDLPVRVGEVTVDTDTGPGTWHGGAGF